MLGQWKQWTGDKDDEETVSQGYNNSDLQSFRAQSSFNSIVVKRVEVN
jgi:hypothetical protein